MYILIALLLVFYLIPAFVMYAFIRNNADDHDWAEILIVLVPVLNLWGCLHIFLEQEMFSDFPNRFFGKKGKK